MVGGVEKEFIDVSLYIFLLFLLNIKYFNKNLRGESQLEFFNRCIIVK